jgi:ribosomal protein S18 acetylase RimI-like enzyme
MTAITLQRVTTLRQLRRFIDFPFRLYKGNKYWCPPLQFDELNTLRQDKNPSFDYCEAAYWLAFRNGCPVGRIAGIINHSANEKWGDRLVRFGWIDFTDDPEVSRTLLEAVESWGKEKGMTGIHGPLGFTDMDPEGMLTEGFEELSSLAAIYNHPYYPVHMEQHGYSRATDWVQYKIEVPESVPRKVERMAAIVLNKFKLRLLGARTAKEIRPYAAKMFNMYNEAFAGLYGFAPLSDKQIENYTRQYFGFIRPEFVSLVIDEKDEIAGFGVTMPSLARALQKCNGHLFPFGFLHLLKAMRYNDTIHMYLVGVRPEFQGKGVLALVYNELTRAYINHGMKTAITHPQMEDNQRAVSIWKNYNSHIHIRRRCYIRQFSNSSL